MQRITRRRYTDDFKAQAIALAESISPAKAARQLNMSVKTLSNWLDASRAGRGLSSPSRKPVSEVESELARLRAENATLKNEEVTAVYATKAAAHTAIASYIHGFYNPTRLYSALGYLSPNDYARRLKQAA